MSKLAAARAFIEPKKRLCLTGPGGRPWVTDKFVLVDASLLRGRAPEPMPDFTCAPLLGAAAPFAPVTAGEINVFGGVRSMSLLTGWKKSGDAKVAVGEHRLWRPNVMGDPIWLDVNPDVFKELCKAGAPHSTIDHSGAIGRSIAFLGRGDGRIVALLSCILSLAEGDQ